MIDLRWHEHPGELPVGTYRVMPDGVAARSSCCRRPFKVTFRTHRINEKGLVQPSTKCPHCGCIEWLHLRNWTVALADNPVAGTAQ